MVYDEAIQKIVLFGGAYGFVNPPNFGLRPDTWTWDDRGWTRQAPQTSPPGRVNAAMAYDAERQQVLLFGGLTQANQVQALANDTWTWDGTTWTKHG